MAFHPVPTERAKQTDDQEDAALGSRRGDELPDELKRREDRLAVIEAAMERLEAEAREKAEAQQGHQIIVGADVTTDANDKQQAGAMATKTRETLESAGIAFPKAPEEPSGQPQQAEQEQKHHQVSREPVAGSPPEFKLPFRHQQSLPDHPVRRRLHQVLALSEVPLPTCKTVTSAAAE